MLAVMKNKKGTGLMEVLSMAPVVIGLLGWSVWFGVESGTWLWFWCMLTIMIVVIIFEIIAKMTTGMTISKQFWTWSTKKDTNGKRPNVWKAWTMVGVMILGWLFLMAHLLWKIIA